MHSRCARTRLSSLLVMVPAARESCPAPPLAKNGLSWISRIGQCLELHRSPRTRALAGPVGETRLPLVNRVEQCLEAPARQLDQKCKARKQRSALNAMLIAFIHDLKRDAVTVDTNAIKTLLKKQTKSLAILAI